MSKRILVVDDDENVREIITEFLLTLNFEVSEANDGEEAIKLCGRLPFDLVITDIRMPKMNGLQLLRKLKTVIPELPIILMTGYYPSKAQEDNMTAKADGYLLKPFSLGTLRQAIQKTVSLG